MAKYKIRATDKFSNKSGILDTPEFDESIIDWQIQQLSEKFPLHVLTKEPLVASFDTGKKQVEVSGYRAVKDMQITPDILIKRGHEIKVTTKDGAKVLHMAINGRDFYFNPEKLTNEPMFNDYFDKIYG